jgi:hypothetical protein
LKRMSRTLAILFIGSSTMGLASSAVAGSAHNRSRDRITNLKELSRLLRFNGLSIDGMNANGEIVGTITRQGHTRIIIDFNPGTKGAHVVVLANPVGFKNISAVGINNAGWIAANTEVADADGVTRSIPFARHIFPPDMRILGGSARWIRLKIAHSGLLDCPVAGIVGNGSVAGTLNPDSRGRSRAVVWHLSSFGTYAPATRLALSTGETYSSASAIWSRGRVEVIGGSQGSTSIGQASRFTVWSPLPVQSGLGQSFLLRSPSAIAGWGSHVFVVGRVMGVDTGAGWRASIYLNSSGSARPSRPTGLAFPKVRGAECFYGADSVSAGRNGKLVAVGSIGCIGTLSHSEALIWRGSRVSNLQSQVPAGSGWQLTNAEFIAHSRIVGVGRNNGHQGVYLLSPRPVPHRPPIT